MPASLAVALSIGGGLAPTVAAIFVDGFIGSTLFTAPGAVLAYILGVSERGHAIGVLFLGAFAFYSLGLFLLSRLFTRTVPNVR